MVDGNREDKSGPIHGQPARLSCNKRGRVGVDEILQPVLLHCIVPFQSRQTRPSFWSIRVSLMRINVVVHIIVGKLWLNKV